MARRPGTSAQELDGSSSRESSYLDHILRRLESGSEQEASPSNEALDASVLSPNFTNPWQFLSTSNPSSPALQRDLYNPPVTSENSWMEMDQQRVPAFQSDDVGSRNSTLLQRQFEQLNSGNEWASGAHGAALQSEAALYEELAAAWYRNGHMRTASTSPQGMWEGLLQAYAAEERWSNLSNADSTGFVNPQLEPTAKAFRSMDTNERWPRRESDSQFVESSHSDAADMENRTGASLAGDPAIRSSGDCAGSPNTSLSSGSCGDDSDDEEIVRNVEPDCSGKRKTPAASGELEEKDDSGGRTSEVTEPKKSTPSETSNRPRKKKNTKRSREPRYAIKTRTDVDIMDDGFKWRKYGQKAVKNSPHPRNYYRCTTPQCPVRKRVERASEDSGMVITTYEGTHTHHTPGLIHRPAPERPPGSILPPAAFRNPNLLPLPPEFTTLAALHQMRSLQQILAQQQIQMPPLPGSLQRESLLRAQQFLGLHDPGEVKPEPYANFNEENNRNFMRFPFPLRRDPLADGDLVRRVLEAEERQQATTSSAQIPVENVESSRPPGDFVSQIQSSLRSRMELERRRRPARSAAPRPPGPAASRSQGPPRRQARSPSGDELVDGLLQEMAKRGEPGIPK